MCKFKVINGQLHKLVFCRSRKGINGRVYARRRRAMCFWVPVDEA